MITKSAVQYAFISGCKFNRNPEYPNFIDLPNALIAARDFLPDRRYKVFALAARGNGHGDTGGIIECAGIRMFWDACADGSIMFEDYKN